jgi:hypothetical protein
MVGTDGGVFAFGDAPYIGSLPGLGVHVDDVAGIRAAPGRDGYWMVGRDGGVFSFGNVPFVGSLPGLGVDVDDIVAVAAAAFEAPATTPAGSPPSGIPDPPADTPEASWAVLLPVLGAGLFLGMHRRRRPKDATPA